MRPNRKRGRQPALGQQKSCSPGLHMNTTPGLVRVMVVDDNARTRYALVSCLSAFGGISVIAEAFDGQDAVDKLRACKPDVIVMDCQMPRMTGMEVTRLVKREWPNMKVVILTVYPDYQPEAILAGADAFLIKGCSFQELISTIRSVVAIGEPGHTITSRDCGIALLKI
jgi:DNA-binding NarL/FixJ family response regulator